MAREGAYALGHDFGGLGPDFGGTDYSVALDLGYTHKEIKEWAKNNPGSFIGDNKKGKEGGLFEAILKGESSARAAAHDRNKYSSSLYTDYIDNYNTGTDHTTTAEYTGRVEGTMTPFEAENEWKWLHDEHKGNLANTLQELVNSGTLAVANVESSWRTTIATTAKDASDYAADVQSGWQTEVADIASGWRVEIAEIQSDTTEYVTDAQTDSAEAIASGQNQNRLDLQKIVNSGLKNVTSLQGDYTLSGIEAQGRWSASGIKLQTESAKEIAEMESEAGLYGSLFAGFWN
jgi:hypothetical protein